MRTALPLMATHVVKQEGQTYSCGLAKRRPQDPNKASPFKQAGQTPRESGLSGSTPARLATLRASLAAAEGRLLVAVQEYLDDPSSMNMRTMYVTYFQWRTGTRRLIAVLRATSASSSGEISNSLGVARSDERAILARLKRTLGAHLLAATTVPESESFAAKAARELGRDLRLDGVVPGAYLRIGRMRSDKNRKNWWIEPYALGLPKVPVKSQGLSGNLVGAPVMYVCDASGKGATAIEAVSPGAVQRRRSRVKLPGTAGPRTASGPIRRIVSGGGPGTGKRA